MLEGWKVVAKHENIGVGEGAEMDVGGLSRWAKEVIHKLPVL